MALNTWLLLAALAGAVSPQFLDFSAFSYFPGVNNQRVPGLQDFANPRTEYNQRQSTSFSYQDTHRQTQATTKRPQSTSYYNEDHRQDQASSKRQSTTTPNYYQEISRPTQSTTKRPQTTTSKPLNFASFIDVPSNDNNRQFFSTQRKSDNSSPLISSHDQIITTKPSSNIGLYNSNPRIVSNQVADSIRRTEERNPYNVYRGSRTQENSRNTYDINSDSSLRPQGSRNQYNFNVGNQENNRNQYETNSDSTGSYTYNRGDTRRPQGSRDEYDRPESSRPEETTRNPYERPINNSYDYTTKRTDSYGFVNTYNGDRTKVNTNGQSSRPSIDESRDPITNKPPRGEESDFIFRDEDVEPEMITGPDEQLMPEEKKRRALQIAERMCSRYGAENSDSVAAIPLLPSPAPITVSVQRCTPDTVPLVVGGQVVPIQQHPHMAAVGWPRLRGGGGYSWKCGGTLVSEHYVLTAAHCSFQDRDNTVVPGPPRVVQLGSARLSDPEATLARVAAVVRHPKYKTPAAYYDLALLKLAAPLRLSDVIRPACVGEPPPPGQNIIATGWGRTEYGGAMSQQLRGVSLPVWDVSECARALGTSRKLPRGPEPDAQMCAGELRGGKDTCQGDSGGPAVVGSPCLWRVVGVTSLGRACGAPRTPALYARALPEFVAAVVWL